MLEAQGEWRDPVRFWQRDRLDKQVRNGFAMSTEEANSKTERVYCNQCQGKTVHRLIENADGRDSEPDDEYWWSTTFDMRQCCGCQEVVLRRTFRFSEDTGDEVRYFPPVMSRYLPRWRFD